MQPQCLKHELRGRGDIDVRCYGNGTEGKENECYAKRSTFQGK